jgi:uncharacterized membrane protein
MTRLLVTSIIITAVAWLGWLTVFLNGGLFPEKVPIHWNIDMEIDDWASAETAAWLLITAPALMTFFLALCWALPRVSPESFQDADTRWRFEFTMLASMISIAALEWFMFDGMRTGELPMRTLLGAMFVSFGLFGWVMRGVKPNQWMGVRTPWTMTSEAVWNKTHEFTARLWMAMALVGILAVFAGAPLLACLAIIVPVVLAPIVASYLYAHAANQKTM